MEKSPRIVPDVIGYGHRTAAAPDSANPLTARMRLRRREDCPGRDLARAAAVAKLERDRKSDARALVVFQQD
jgi:hypothetical protein